MPATVVLIYQETTGSAPLLGWLDAVPSTEIAQAVRNLAAYQSAPLKHTYCEDE